MTPRQAKRHILTSSWSFRFGFLNWNERFWVFGSEERWEKTSKWERVIWRLGCYWGCWAGETEGQFGHRRWNWHRVNKNDKTFHIKSWLSYFPLLSFENVIMLGWEAQSTTFLIFFLILFVSYCNIIHLYIYLFHLPFIFFFLTILSLKQLIIIFIRKYFILFSLMSSLIPHNLLPTCFFFLSCFQSQPCLKFAFFLPIVYFFL